MRADQTRFTDDDMIVIHELLVYSTIEMMRALLVSGKTELPDDLAVGMRHNRYQVPIAQILSNFGADGAKHNRIYSACGLAISPGSEDVNGQNNPQNVFGGRAESSLAWAGGRAHFGKCVNCNQKTLVGVKNWCKACISGHCGTKK